MEIDSRLTRSEAIGTNGPEGIRSAQSVVKVEYIGFDKARHIGQLIIHKELSGDVRDWFKLALKLKFPIEKVVPAVTCEGNDSKLMALNISSGFNYRKVAGTDRLSLHSRGLAFDINPVQNPYIRREGDLIISPPNSYWQPDKPGTLSYDHQLVQFMLERGWEWGGDWSLEDTGRVDYQHFQKEI